MRTITLFIAVVAVGIYGHAEEIDIKGAFGIELGQLIPPDSPMIQVEETTESGGVRLVVLPSAPVSAINGYVVFVLPKSRRVYIIIGLAKNCDSYTILPQALTNKYGNPGHISTHPTWTQRILPQDSLRRIQLRKCADNNEYVSLIYRDIRLDGQVGVEFLGTDNL